MTIIKSKISKDKFEELFKEQFMVKTVVDIQKKILSIGCEFHIDCAEELCRNDSLNTNLWGVNIYPKDKKIDFISLINIKPAQNNRSMDIQNQEIKQKVEEIIAELLFND